MNFKIIPKINNFFPISPFLLLSLISKGVLNSVSLSSIRDWTVSILNYHVGSSGSLPLGKLPGMVKLKGGRTWHNTQSTILGPCSTLMFFHTKTLLHQAPNWQCTLGCESNSGFSPQQWGTLCKHLSLKIIQSKWKPRRKSWTLTLYTNPKINRDTSIFFLFMQHLPKPLCSFRVTCESTYITRHQAMKSLILAFQYLPSHLTLSWP